MRKAFATVLLALLAAAGFAQVLLSTGFEAPEFVAGPLDGQAGWLSDPGGGPPDEPVSNFYVTSAVAQSGSQSVSVHRSSFSGNEPTWAWKPLTPIYNSETTANDLLVVRFGMYVNSPTSFFDPFMGIDVYTPSVARIARLTVDASDGGSVMLFNSFDGGVTSATYAALETWNTFDLLLDFDSHVATARMNGVDLGVTLDLNPAHTQVADADMYADMSNALPGFGAGYFDDFSITASPVPEPMSLVGLSIALGVLVRRRRPPAR